MNGKKIIIADDDPHVKRVLGLTLERAGYSLRFAANGEEALAAIKEELPDVLISDIQMPKLSGKELCLEIAKDFPDRTFLIIIVTSLTAGHERNWVSDFENLEFFEKPISPKRMAARLEEYFQGI